MRSAHAHRLNCMCARERTRFCAASRCLTLPRMPDQRRPARLCGWAPERVASDSLSLRLCACSHSPQRPTCMRL
eukprot:1978501-Pleurochrysis_carterae.AAC.1